ncbi:protein kinase [Arthrobacter gandavensis]|uniref:serine/threonine protein kinase n=1 Tax=Arthrobacter gandavensis TaxID=169960 RepID=UPI0018906850|nr:protein kinase [Arthrobacter gandavensis]MBF4994886.1 protein kinase [Arthrobacter gandavensis]
MQMAQDPDVPGPVDADSPLRPVLPDAEWRVGRCLGRGSSSSVWLVERPGEQKRYALKVPLGLDAEADGFEMRRELAILSRYRHENLLGIEGFLATSRGNGLLLEYAPGDSLARLVAARGALSAGETVTVLVAVGRALDCLHAEGAVHGDVSPGNVLFTANGKPLLADFGTGRLLAEPSTGGTGTPGFTAPRTAGSAAEHGAGAAGDVFALGALAWFMLTGRPLVPGLRLPLSVLLPELPAALRDLVDSALEDAPHSRPGAGDFAARVLRSCPAEPLDLLPSVHPSVAAELRTRRTSHPVRSRRARTPRWRKGRRSRRAPWEEPRRKARTTVPGTGARKNRGRAGERRGLLAAAALLVGAIAVLGAIAAFAPQLLRPDAVNPVPAAGEALDTSGPESGPTPRELAVLAGDDPLAAAKVLTALRARAFAVGNPVLLEQVNHPGSAAEAADLVAVQALQERGERLEGLTAAVLDASAEGISSAERVRVAVSAELSAWKQVRSDGTLAAEPGTAQRQDVVLELQRTGGNWRIASVLPAAARLQEPAAGKR